MPHIDSFSNLQSADFFSRFPGTRYLAVYLNGELASVSAQQLESASDSESDRYEELIANPAMLKIAQQRGNIDCGGLDYLIVRYGNFFQFVAPFKDGHISICIEPDHDPIKLGPEAMDYIKSQLDK